MAALSARALAAGMLALLSACAFLPFARGSARRCPAALVAPARLGADFERRFRYRVEETSGAAFSVELAAEKRDDELVVVGLTPLGAVAFALRQRGDEVEVLEHLRPLFPPPPENALADLSRAGLLGAGALPGPAEIEPPGCGYRATLRALGSGATATPARRPLAP